MKNYCVPFNMYIHNQHYLFASFCMVQKRTCTAIPDFLMLTYNLSTKKLYLLMKIKNLN
jgi:hypothetical protein